MSAFLGFVKYVIIFALAIAGFLLIVIPRSQNSVWEAFGVALLASAIFSTADLVREYLAHLQENAALPAPLRAQPELRDPEFWLEVFNKLPPIFVKRIEPGVPLTHLIDNTALHEFQGAPTGLRAEDQAPDIKTDHDAGDKQAANAGVSIQVEYSEQGGLHTPQLILTVKRRFLHRGASYLVGTYVPITLDEKPRTSTLNVGQIGGQVVFRLERQRENGLSVGVGKAVLERLAAVARGSA